MNTQQKTNDFGPAITLMILTPLLTELLPGATRFSSIFVFPIEVCVWGGGALLIRYSVRKYQLSWVSMLFMAIALSLAEEFIIQQTSAAPLVIRLKGITYARAGGINYVYLLWALIYESVFVVFAPIYLVEFIFPKRKERLWISKGGFFILVPLFILGCLLAWFSWTRIARPKIFHLPIYNLPVMLTITVLLIILALIILSFRIPKNINNEIGVTKKAPAPWILFLLSAVWSVLLYGLVLLGFGIQPDFPPMLAVPGGLILAIVPIVTLPKWIKAINWNGFSQFTVISGLVTGSMAISFIGFIGTVGADLIFKIITNILAFLCLVRLGMKWRSDNSPEAVLQHK